MGLPKFVGNCVLIPDTTDEIAKFDQLTRFDRNYSDQLLDDFRGINERYPGFVNSNCSQKVGDSEMSAIGCFER
jgi:hypothetical protein